MGPAQSFSLARLLGSCRRAGAGVLVVGVGSAGGSQGVAEYERGREELGVALCPQASCCTIEVEEEVDILEWFGSWESCCEQPEDYR